MSDAVTDPGRREIRRRTAIVVTVVAVLAVPAGALRALCIGRGCDDGAQATPEVVYCRLPPALRARLADGFWEGRSPEIMAVSHSRAVSGGTAFARGRAPAWPSLEDPTGGPVPLVFSGSRVRRADIGPARLDAIAPTLAAIARLRRPHPEVRSGRALDAIVAPGTPPRLIAVIALHGTGASGAHELPAVEALARNGAATFAAETGSLPLDPAAVLTTIGTGGLPRQHGIPGSILRNDDGTLVEAWGRGAPVSVIATLADDLDRRGRDAPLIGLVGTRPSDRGLIGGEWYPGGDRDEIEIVGPAPRAAARAAEDVLARGFGRDETTDLLAVALQGRGRALSAAVDRIVASARSAARGSTTIVVAGTGKYDAALDARALRRMLPGRLSGAVEALAPGGIYVDQKVIAGTGLSDDEIAAALRRVRGGRLFADSFGAIAISLGRYC